jgi:hypothetical protein
MGQAVEISGALQPSVHGSDHATMTGFPAFLVFYLRQGLGAHDRIQSLSFLRFWATKEQI